MCETSLLTSREECKLGVFENRVLSEIIGSKEERGKRVMGKIHNEELDYL